MAATSPVSSWTAPISESSIWARTSSSASDMASSGVAEVARATAEGTVRLGAVISWHAKAIRAA